MYLRKNVCLLTNFDNERVELCFRAEGNNKHLRRCDECRQ